MKGLVFAGITPHGSSIIEELAGEEGPLFKSTREGMEVLGKRLKAHNPDTIIILTPHGLRLKDYNAIYTSEYCKGILSEKGGTIDMEMKCDRPMAEAILQNATGAGIPCVGANFGALSGAYSNIEMDWGTFIPLYFLVEKDRKKPEIVVIGPTRDIDLNQLVTLGEIVGKIADKSNKKVALIASADQSHVHDEQGPYGYHPDGCVYDHHIITIIEKNHLEDLLKIDLELVNRAMPDSLWQMLILYGALKIVPMTGDLISYQVPSYFGMLVASYERSGER